MHLGPVKVPLEESFPRYDDQGFNFYYNQEDYLRETQKRRNTWSYNIIRPNAINGFAPHGGFIYPFTHTIPCGETPRLMLSGNIQQTECQRP